MLNGVSQHLEGCAPAPSRSVVMALNPSDLQAIQQLFQVIADTNWPMHRGGAFTVVTENGREAVVPVSGYRPPTRRTFAPDDDDGLTDMERDVLQAVAEHDGDTPLTGEQIASAAGYEYTGRFREVLASLVRRGRLGRGPNGRGYITPAA